jgi:5'-deoxynucleotidase YfbR-like HD superfamily hydrolase
MDRAFSLALLGVAMDDRFQDWRKTRSVNPYDHPVIAMVHDLDQRRNSRRLVRSSAVA